MQLEPHQTRVIVERDQLAEKIVKLDEFILSEVYEALPEDDRFLLVNQQRAMCLYLSILSQRVDRF